MHSIPDSFDPLVPDTFRMTSGDDIPPHLGAHVAGSRYPTRGTLDPFYAPQRFRRTDTILPLAPAIVTGPDGRLQVDYDRLALSLSSTRRDAHTVVWGITGSGKSTRGLQNLLAADLRDPDRVVIFASLKGDESALMEAIAAAEGIEVQYLDLTDPRRTLRWNPLESCSREEAFRTLAAFAEANINPRANDSHFWLQVGTSVEVGLWDAGVRSFARQAAVTAGGAPSIRRALEGIDTDHARAARAFCEGSGPNLDTALAEVNGWLGPFRGTELASTTSTMDLEVTSLFSGRGILYIRCPESKLVTSRIAYNLLIQWLIDAATSAADRRIDEGRPLVPVSLFLEDLPAWSAIPALPDRLTTLRSRRIAVTTAIQSHAALRHAYGADAAEAVASSFGTRILLPGIDYDDAERFSRATGYATRQISIRDDGSGLMHREPVITANAIRSPECRHFLFGPPVTFLFPDVAFQCYLAPIYRRPDLWGPLHQAARDRSNAGQRPAPRVSSRSGASKDSASSGSIPPRSPVGSKGIDGTAAKDHRHRDPGAGATSGPNAAGGRSDALPLPPSGVRRRPDTSPPGPKPRRSEISRRDPGTFAARERSGHVADAQQAGFWVFDRFVEVQSRDLPVANFVIRVEAGERFPLALPGGIACWWRRVP